MWPIPQSILCVLGYESSRLSGHDTSDDGGMRSDKHDTPALIIQSAWHPAGHLMASCAPGSPTSGRASDLSGG